MIFELVKRDPAWRAMPWLVPAAAAICACPPSPVSAAAGFGVVMGLFFAAAPHLRATRFYAGLPIAGRDLVLARAFSIMAVVWLPALAGTAAAAVFSRPSPVVVGPLVMAAMCTLAAGLAQSIRVRELAGPKWMLLPLFILALEASLFLVHYGANALTPTSCALAGIALMARAWRAVPKSFELAPAKPGAADGAAAPGPPAGVSSPRFAWVPVLRSVFSLSYSMMLLFTLWWVALPLRPLFSSFLILVMWQGARLNTLWLRPLPIRPRALLLTIVAPILFALAGGYFGGFYIGRHPRPVPALPIQVLDLGALLGCALVVVLVCALLDWRRLGHVPLGVRGIVYCVLMVGPIVWIALQHGDDVDPLRKAVPHLAQALPNSVGVAVALVAAVLAALWWAIEKAFAEAEHRDKPRAPKDEYFV